MTHTLYFDRDVNSINGFLTLQTDDGHKVFERLKARSGQRFYTHTSWERGKSPIPFGRYWMATKHTILFMEPKNTPFFPIASEKGAQIIWDSEGKGLLRSNIGLHMENQYPGSAGCVVVVNRAEAERLFHYLTTISRAEPYIRFVVL
jgi:hypothetical protein